MEPKYLPSEWEKIDKIKIVDPDGWRVDNKPWDYPIARKEWKKRSENSTICRTRRDDG